MTQTCSKAPDFRHDFVDRDALMTNTLTGLPLTQSRCSHCDKPKETLVALHNESLATPSVPRDSVVTSHGV
jgi:hypothetical protein